MGFENYAQQGDVVIRRIKKIPQEAKPVETAVLQYGEHTGHAHRMFDVRTVVGNLAVKDDAQKEPAFQVFEADGKKFIRVLAPCEVRHEEHKPIAFTPGDFEVSIVREYDHFEEEARSVLD